MEFFKLIASKMQEGQQLNLTIRKLQGDKLVMSLAPDVKNAGGELTGIRPLTLNGTAEDFEAEFEKALEPMEKAFGLVSSVEEFNASLKKAEEATKMAKAKKDTEEKQKKAFKDAIAKARQLNEAHKFADARSVLAKAAALPGADKALIETVSKEIDKMNGVGDMFGGVKDESDGKDIEVAGAPAETPAEEPTDEPADESETGNDDENGEED